MTVQSTSAMKCLRRARRPGAPRAGIRPSLGRCAQRRSCSCSDRVRSRRRTTSSSRHGPTIALLVRAASTTLRRLSNITGSTCATCFAHSKVIANAVLALRRPRIALLTACYPYGASRDEVQGCTRRHLAPWSQQRLRRLRGARILRAGTAGWNNWRRGVG